MAVRVAVIYHIWPHYRQAVAREMDRRRQIDYTFFGSGEPFKGIQHADPKNFKRFVRAPFRYFGPILWQQAVVRSALSRDFDALILVGDPHFASCWVGAAIARARGIPVFFWAHGWLRSERGLKRLIRNSYYLLANHLLLYAERGKRLGAEAGYPADRMTVIYNSLDVAKADDIFARIENGSLNTLNPRALFADPSRPLLICTARLIDRCRFDVLIDAAARLKSQGTPVNVLLVGDGPARAALEAQAAANQVAVHFYGASYDEEVNGQFIYNADLTVSPGKIGLTAMHSLMYGTPAITHSKLDDQMPEVEALTENVTGAFFSQGDVESLAQTIQSWAATHPDRAATRQACRAAIATKWNPWTQAAIIEAAVLDEINRKTERAAKWNGAGKSIPEA